MHTHLPSHIQMQLNIPVQGVFRHAATALCKVIRPVLGFASACMLLALLLQPGRANATPLHDEQGAQEYRSLVPKAEAGDAEAQTTLGLMRLHGNVVKRDLKTARNWLGKAAVQNNVQAQYALGQLLLLDVFNANNADLEKQLAEGLGWLRRASREHHAPSQLLYAETILESQHDSPFGHSKIEAQQHLEACASVNLACTQYALSRLDMEGVEAYCPRTESCEKRRKLLIQLAQAGDAQAHYRLSKFEGEDNMFWLRRAVRLQHTQASFELASQVLNGQAILLPEDPALLSLLESAATQGHAPAMFLLGSLLHEGTRFPVNKPLGQQWIELAAQQGHEPASVFLAQIKRPPKVNPPAEQVESVQPTKSTP